MMIDMYSLCIESMHRHMVPDIIHAICSLNSIELLDGRDVWLPVLGPRPGPSCKSRRAHVVTRHIKSTACKLLGIILSYSIFMTGTQTMLKTLSLQKSLPDSSCLAKLRSIGNEHMTRRLGKQ